MEIYEYDMKENLIEEIEKEVGIKNLQRHGINSDEDLIRFALSFVLSNIDGIEEYFYEVK